MDDLLCVGYCYEVGKEVKPSENIALERDKDTVLKGNDEAF